MQDVQLIGLAESIASGDCVLILGPDIPAIPGDGQPPISIRDALTQYLAAPLEKGGANLQERTLFSVAQQFEDDPKQGSQLKNYARSFFRDRHFSPGPIHSALAKCPFRIIVTTAQDQIFRQALERQSKIPREYVYAYNEKRLSFLDDEEFSAESPIVYYLYGNNDSPTSLVLSENNLLDFVLAIARDRPIFPNTILRQLREHTLLFVGFGIKYWYLRVILKLLIRAMEIRVGVFALESLGELAPDERARTVLFYDRGARIEVVDMDTLEFVEELSERLGRYQLSEGTRRSQARRLQLFISYERSDEEWARSLRNALEKYNDDSSPYFFLPNA
jgi:hypothetical protein